MKASKSLCRLLAASMALGCSTTTVRSDRDPRVNLSSYETFEVKKGQVIANDVVDERDTLVHDRVQSAIEQELQQKGLQETAQTPDLIATYTARGQEVVEVMHGGTRPHDYTGANGWVDSRGGEWLAEDTEGTLVLDLVDAKTNKLVWRSIVEIDDNDLRSAKTITNAVDKGLEKYPGPLATE